MNAKLILAIIIAAAGLIGIILAANALAALNTIVS
jgi:hypothetical protein